MMVAGIIWLNAIPYSSLMLLIKKRDGGGEFVWIIEPLTMSLFLMSLMSYMAPSSSQDRYEILISSTFK